MNAAVDAFYYHYPQSKVYENQLTGRVYIKMKGGSKINFVTENKGKLFKVYLPM